MSKLSAEAIATVNGAIATRLKRNLAGTTTICADCVIHDTLFAAAGALLAGDAAIFAALRLVGKSFFRKKFLFAGGEGEVLSAIFADDDFVAIHVLPSILYIFC